MDFLAPPTGTPPMDHLDEFTRFVRASTAERATDDERQTPPA